MSETASKDQGGPPNLIVFANRIRRLREDAGFSFTAFADLAGISTGHLSYIERGVRSPSEEKIAQIARILNVEPSALLVGPESESEYREWFQKTEERREEFTPTLLLGSRLREIRLRQGLTMNEVAQRTGEINVWLIRAFEVSGRKPDPRQMFLLSRAFGYDGVEAFTESLAKVELDLHPDFDSEDSRNAISRGMNLALRAARNSHLDLVLDETIVDGKVHKSRSLDGDLLAGIIPMLAGSVIRLSKMTKPVDGTLCVVMVGNFPAVMARITRGKVLDANGRHVRGDLWRVENILYPSKIF